MKTLQAGDLAPQFTLLNQDNHPVSLSISTDSPKKLAQFVEKKSLNFTLLSDEDHQVAEQFGVWGEKKFMGRTYDGIHRISFLIDEQGKIQHVFDKFKTGEHHQVVLDYLQSLKIPSQNNRTFDDLSQSAVKKMIIFLIYIYALFFI